MPFRFRLGGGIPHPRSAVWQGLGSPWRALTSSRRLGLPSWLLGGSQLPSRFPSSSAESVLPVCSPTDRPRPGVCSPRRFRSPCASERNALVLVLMLPVPSLGRKPRFCGERYRQWLLCPLRQQIKWVQNRSCPFLLSLKTVCTWGLSLCSSKDLK